MSKKLLITNVQRMSLSDGPGIRTTVFFKGCNLRCPWCANPENISGIPQEYSIGGRKGIYGKEYSYEELYKLIMRDRFFYGEEGGVTFSGGEPLLYINDALPLINRLKEEQISVALETALYVPYQAWKNAIDSIDYFYVDIKVLDPMTSSEVLGGDVQCYKDNVRYLKENGKKTVFRIPLNKEYTMKQDNLSLLFDFLKMYSEIPVEVFPTHNLGKEKYRSLGLRETKFARISTTEINEIVKCIREIGCNVSINDY